MYTFIRLVPVFFAPSCHAVLLGAVASPASRRWCGRMAWRSAYLRRRAPLSAPTFVAAFFYYEEPFFSTVSALIPGIFGFGQVRGGGAKDASETAMTAPSAFTASTIEWPARAATREIEIPSRGTTVLACSSACHDTAVEGHALRADESRCRRLVLYLRAANIHPQRSLLATSWTHLQACPPEIKALAQAGALRHALV